MVSFIIKILIEQITAALKKAVADYFKFQQLKKTNIKKAKDILSEKNPVKRATNMRDFLNSK